MSLIPFFTLGVPWSPRCLNVVGLVILVLSPGKHACKREEAVFFSRMLLWCLFPQNTHGFHFEVWNARALWKTLSEAAHVVVHEGKLKRTDMDWYGAVSFSLRVQIHNISFSRQLHTFPPSERKSRCRSPELSYTVHLLTVSVFLCDAFLTISISLFCSFFLRICRTDT